MTQENNTSENKIWIDRGSLGEYYLYEEYYYSIVKSRDVFYGDNYKSYSDMSSIDNYLESKR